MRGCIQFELSPGHEFASELLQHAFAGEIAEPAAFLGAGQQAVDGLCQRSGVAWRHIEPRFAVQIGQFDARAQSCCDYRLAADLGLCLLYTSPSPRDS